MKTNNFILILSLFFIFISNSCTKEVEKVVEKIIYKTPTDSSGCVSSDSLTICYTKTSPCSLQGEVFTFTVSGKATEKDVERYEWYFGDGDGDSTKTKSITKVYKNSGYYSVLLKILKTDKQYIKAYINPFAFGQNVIPEAEIKGIDPVNTYGNTATFRFQANIAHSNSSYSYSWDFGDGKSEGIGQYLNHTFDLKSAEQKVKITLKVTSKAGCQGIDTQTIVIPAYYNITDTISSSVTDACSDYKEEFTFKGPIKNVPVGAQYIWNFDDGINGQIGNPIKHRYTHVHTYKVALNIYYNGQLIYTGSKDVDAKSQNARPPAQLKLCCAYTSSTQQKYFFQNTVSGNDAGNIINWEWDFGDGSPTLNGKVDSYEKYYTRDNIDKNYTVLMTVTSETGCKSKDSTTVFVPKL